MRSLGAMLLGLALGGCSSLAGFEGPDPAEGQHSICYSRLASSPDQVQTLGRESCGGAEPHFLKQGMDLSACPLLVPERVAFSCGATP